MRSNYHDSRFRPSLRTLLGGFILGAIAVSCGFSFPERTRIDESDSERRSIGEYRRDVKAFMKLSKSEDAQIERNAIFNLCELHWEVVSDPRFQSNQQIQGFRVVIANRLETYVKDVKKEQLRAQRLAKSKRLKSSSESQLQGTGNSDSVATSGADGGSSSEPTASDEFEMMYQSSADSYSTLGQLSGGPNQLFGYAGGQLGPPWDHGPELVNLIQNTINPEFWRANGGNGAIHYFQPLRVLVIGASTQVHENTLDLLYKLRRRGTIARGYSLQQKKPPIKQAPKPHATVVCPFCHYHVTVHPTQAGFVVGCPKCSGQFQVPGPGNYQPPPPQTAYARPQGYQAFVDKKIAAGICGIIFGGMGIHKFILGFPGAGTIMLVFSLIGVFTGMCIVVPIVATIVMNIIGLIEGITYLTKSDEDFYLTYAVQRKEWF